MKWEGRWRGKEREGGGVGGEVEVEVERECEGREGRWSGRGGMTSALVPELLQIIICLAQKPLHQTTVNVSDRI